MVTKRDLLAKLKEYFGFESFKGNQEAIIANLLEGNDTFVLMPTGGGKSLCYQLPSLLMDGTAIVISPLIALMKNQVDAMRNFSEDDGIAHFLNSSLNKAAIAQVKKDVVSGKTKLLYVAPESLTKEENIEFLKSVKISFYAVDEAHCISEWGHDFRPEYRNIRPIITEIGIRPLIALTATATPKVQHDIQKNLGMLDARVFKSSFNRPNLYYEVRPKNKTEILSRLIDIYNPKLSVVFCNTKRQVDELISELKGRGYFADGIHGDMKQQQRDRVMDDFRSGKTEILIATDVAARGIDVDGVDIVFNYDLPQDEEYYVHRIGRTGRAGKSGLALSFISGREVYKLKDIERYCKTKILAKPIPSLDDVKNTKMDGIFDKIKEMIEADEHRAMLDMVEEHVNQEDYTSMDMAAALLKMIVGDTLDRVDEVESFHFDENADSSRMVRLFINVGKKDKITPANILGAIAGESGMPGRLVGAIDMMDNYTFVDVPAKHAEAVLAAMNDNVLIKGRKVNVEKANVSAKPARKSKSKPDTRRRKDESRGKHDKLKERRGKSGKVRRNGEKY